MTKPVTTINRWTREGLIADLIELYATHGGTEVSPGVTIDRLLSFLRDEHAALLNSSRPGAKPYDFLKAREVAELIRLAEQAIKTRAANTLTTEPTP